MIIFLPISLNMCFGCSKEPSHWDGSFEYPQQMFWLRNYKNNFLLHTLIWGPGCSVRFERWLALYIPDRKLWQALKMGWLPISHSNQSNFNEPFGILMGQWENLMGPEIPWYAPQSKVNNRSLGPAKNNVHLSLTLKVFSQNCLGPSQIYPWLSHCR